MTPAELEQRLRKARDCDAWVTVLARYFDAAGLVFGHGTDNAGDEAYWLLRHLQGWSEASWNAPPDAKLLPRALAVAERRVRERIPLAYLLGEAWFAGLRFEVDERVLVPRSPLAEVIARGFAPWCDLVAGDRILDIGTGSGCIGIAAAHYCEEALVVITDVSRDALAVASRNVAVYGVGDRVRLVEADLFPPGDERYRVIVSNPPYVPEAEVAALPPEYHHEPAIGLASGASGFDAAERIVQGAAARLTEDGILFVEVGAGAESFAAAHPRWPLTWLEFEHGGDGVFVATAAQVQDFLRTT
jgi:ribosomal protein L3 glutamine methyltransferase